MGRFSARNRSNASARKRRRSSSRLAAGTLLALAVVVASGASDLVEFASNWRGANTARVDAPAAAADSPADVIIPRALAIHPDNQYFNFLSTRAPVSNMRTLETVRSFQELLSLYALRQSTDDNYTMRVIDSRTGGLLELYALDSLRIRNQGSEVDWGQVDEIRRRATRRLVDAHEDSGIPRHEITVKWGRRDQVFEARARETAYVEHEINLARYLNLSLLATEIGTVETFNLDHVVSRVGARSRYQMMPSTLRNLGVEHYDLEGAAGGRVAVREEWHPLIALEAAFIVLRAYSNAMGHEIPGLSAYHTGPYNVFRLFGQYLTADSTLYTSSSHVVGAYQWGLTDGFDHVTRRTSFGSQSRGYLPSLYGSLRATEDVPIDTTKTLLVDRVQFGDDVSMFLSQLVDSLDAHAADVDWRTPADDSTTYLRFRRINPHINLPRTESHGVPVEANVKLVRTVGREPVRFFLPTAAVDKLALAGYTPFDQEATLSFGHDSFTPRPEEIFPVDVEYANLVADIARFGFTIANREQLKEIVELMEAQYDANPGYHRWMQREIVRLHEWVWRSRNFDELAERVESARARASIPELPPAPIPDRIGAKPLEPLAARQAR